MDPPDPEVLLGGLREAGLSRYEAAVYLGLVTDQSARVAEISKRTGVPAPKVYQALDTLVEKGFCTLGGDSVNRYQPVPPRVALEGRLARLRAEQEGLQQLGTELGELLQRGRGQELWAPPVEIVKGVRQISRVLVERIRGASREICFFCKPPIVRAPEVPQALHEASDKGLSMRLIFEQGYLDQEDAPEEVALYRTLKGERRSATELPTKLVLIDDQIALASISRQGAASFLMLVLRHDGLIAHFRASFERAWEAAEPSA